MNRPEYGFADFRPRCGYFDAMPPAQCRFSVCTPSPGTSDYEAARQAAAASRRNLSRVDPPLVRPRELARGIRVETRYTQAFRSL